MSDTTPWDILNFTEKIDSFNFDGFKDLIESHTSQPGCRLALDFTHLKFLGLPAIKYISETGKRVHADGGQLALVGLPEKIKRHFGIYGRIDNILVLRTEEEWRRLQSFAQGMVPVSESFDLSAEIG